MYLLIAGASETAQALIADAFLAEHSDWRHLPLEDIWDPAADTEEAKGALVFSLLIACQTLRDTMEEGAEHVLITCPTPAMLPTLEEKFPDMITRVQIGSDEEWNVTSFHHVLNTPNGSVRDICTALTALIA